jgi:hypothetical protein
MPAAELSAAITSFKAALDIAKAMVGLRDAEAMRSKTIELQGLILEALNQAIEAREAQSAQLDRLRELEAEIVNLKAWDTQKQRYELKQIGVGVVAYMLKPPQRGSEPPHWLCPNCYTNGKPSFLQYNGAVRGVHRFYACVSCKAIVETMTPPKWM